MKQFDDNEHDFSYQNEEKKEQVKEPKNDYEYLENVLPKNPQMYQEPEALQQNKLPKLQAQDPHIALIALQNVDLKPKKKDQEEEEKYHKIEKNNIKEQNNVEEENKELKEQVKPADITPPEVQKPKLLTEEYFEGIDMREFLTKPCPKGYLIQTTIRRDKSGFNKLYPNYEMALSNGNKYLMSAQKKPWNLTSNYLISLSKDDYESQSDQTLGKVRSNFLGTAFKIYGKGLNPATTTDQEKIREEIGAVLYEQNRFGNDKPRVMKNFLPEVKENGEQVIFKPLNEDQGIIQNYEEGKQEGIDRYINKPPK